LRNANDTLPFTNGIIIVTRSVIYWKRRYVLESYYRRVSVCCTNIRICVVARHIFIFRHLSIYFLLWMRPFLIRYLCSASMFLNSGTSTFEMILRNIDISLPPIGKLIDSNVTQHVTYIRVITINNTFVSRY